MVPRNQLQPRNTIFSPHTTFQIIEFESETENYTGTCIRDRARGGRWCNNVVAVDVLSLAPAPSCVDEANVVPVVNNTQTL